MEPAGRASELAGRASEPAWRALDPVRRAAEEAAALGGPRINRTFLALFIWDILNESKKNKFGFHNRIYLEVIGLLSKLSKSQLFTFCRKSTELQNLNN